MESKEQKDTYRQMIIDELHLHVRANEVVIEEEHITQAQKNRKDFLSLTQKMKILQMM